MLVIEGCSRKRGIKGVISYHITQIQNIKHARLMDVFNEIKEKLKKEFQEYINNLLEEGCNEALISNMEKIRRRYVLSHNFYPDASKWKFSARKTKRLLEVDNLLETMVKYGRFAYNTMPTLQFIIRGVPADAEFVEDDDNIENIMERLYKNDKPKSEKNKQLIEKLDAEYKQFIQYIVHSYDQSRIVGFITGEDVCIDLIGRKEIVHYIHHVPLDNLNDAHYDTLLYSDYHLLHGISCAVCGALKFRSYDEIKDLVEIAANNGLKKIETTD